MTDQASSTTALPSRLNGLLPGLAEQAEQEPSLLSLAWKITALFKLCKLDCLNSLRPPFLYCGWTF